MAKGTQTLDFEFLLCDVITVNVHAIIRFGIVESIRVSYQGKTLNMDEYLFDEENDFISLENYLISLAQEYYDEPLEIVFIPEKE